MNNSDKRKKTLIISMLAFLFAGGGIFLFFIIQGSNDLTGKNGKNKFSYGSAAREGVSSFFRAIGVAPDEDAVLEKEKEGRMSLRGFLSDGEPAATDVSDWLAKGSSSAPPSLGRSGSSAAPTKVPKMGMRALSAGKGGGGSSKSSGSTSRFGAGSESGETSINTKAQAGKTGTTDKGTLGALKNAKAMLGGALRSDSAMTAKNKWDQSFGASGGKKGGELAYNKSGLVGLDKIKSGEIASLKTGVTPDASAFQRDKEAESKDPVLNAAKEAAEEKSKADAEAEVKKAAVKAALDGLGDGISKAGGDSKTEPGVDPGRAPITDEEREEAKSLDFFEPESMGDGTAMQDQKVDITRMPDGGTSYEITGNMIAPDGTKIDPPYTDVIIRSPDGKLTFQ